MKILISVRYGRLAISGLLYKQGIMEVLMRHILLSAGDSLVLRLRCGSAKYLDRNHSMDSSYFRDICDTLKREVMKNEGKEMLWKEEESVGT